MQSKREKLTLSVRYHRENMIPMDPVKELDEYHPNERNEKSLIVKDLRPRQTKEEQIPEQQADLSSVTPSVTESTADTQAIQLYPTDPLETTPMLHQNQTPLPDLDLQGEGNEYQPV